ncbi:MAG: hypothetical protein CHACPFDD_01599 [Phycisphaerae bacterium]|nr:hypothetical protein [Phycisphaerae bacterium]
MSVAENTGTADVASIFQDVELPSPPKVALVLLQMIDDPTVSVRDIAAVMGVDPSLCARLLKLANSSAYGQRRQVDSIDRAAVVLGLDYLKVICLAVQLTAPFKSWKRAGVDVGILWRDAVLRASLARHAARIAGDIDYSKAFLVGLLQDVGVPLLATAFPDRYAPHVAGDVVDHNALFAWETSEFGYNHPDAAAKVLDSWGLPPSLTRPIAVHHSLKAPQSDMAGLESIAVVAGGLTFGAAPGCTHNAARFALFSERLKLDKNSTPVMVRHAAAEFAAISALFDELVTPTTNPRELLAGAIDGIVS